MPYELENHMVSEVDFDKDLDRFFGVNSYEAPHKCNHKGTMGCCSICGGCDDD